MTTIERKWGASGVGTVQRFTLGAAARADIRSQLRAGRVADSLFAALERAGSFYLSAKGMARASSPAAVRKNLRRAAAAADKLCTALNALDGNSCQLVDLVRTVTVNDRPEQALNTLDMRRQAMLTVLTLDGASRLANAYPRRGALPDYAKRYLARDIADALRAQGFKPTTSRGGDYETVLGIMVRALTGRPPQSAHDLAARGLKVRKTVFPDGHTEYEPDEPI